MGVNQSAKRKHHIKDDEEVNFDHFQILRAIGKGSFGKVCIVQKKDTGQMYAMKYMSKAVCFERDALRNVLREIEILTQLDHPYLVNLWFSFHDEEDMFLVQDLLLGGDLRYHLMQNVMFPPEAVRIYVAELGLALDYLQQKHIIHRDIKPDNILLDEEGHAHITDFNVATKLEDGKEYACALSGTKPYMAPEIFACYAEEIPGYCYSVDWWSLGVVAYELCSGRRPYEIHSHTPNKDIRQMQKGPPEWPVTWPTEFTMLVQQLLQLDALQRITNLESLKTQPYMMEMNFEDIMEKKIAPMFVPPKGHLNCDPTFELEEMIVESRPLHKKKKRLAKQRSLRELQTTPFGEQISQETPLDPLAEEFTTFNRQRELERVERERKEAEWEQELLRAMEASSTFSSNSSARKEFRLSDSQLPAECQSPGSGLESPSSSSSLAHASTSVASSSAHHHHPLGQLHKPSTSSGGASGGASAKKGEDGEKGDDEDDDHLSKLPSSSAADSKKQAWAKRRSLTMPEGAKLWKKSLKH